MSNKKTNGEPKYAHKLPTAVSTRQYLPLAVDGTTISTIVFVRV